MTEENKVLQKFSFVVSVVKHEFSIFSFQLHKLTDLLQSFNINFRVNSIL